VGGLGPSMDLPKECQERGVCLGDAGLVVERGVFHLLFNIFLPCDHPINLGRTPKGFNPMAQQAGDTLTKMMPPNWTMWSERTQRRQLV
jgi:hypothetical protein